MSSLKNKCPKLCLKPKKMSKTMSKAKKNFQNTVLSKNKCPKLCLSSKKMTKTMSKAKINVQNAV
jgi:hypothetical protein